MQKMSEITRTTEIREGHERFRQGIADYLSRSWSDEEIFLNERFSSADEELKLWANMADITSDLPALAGLTMTAKACFDVAGWTTSCASAVLADNAPATVSATLVHKLRQAGATLTAQTNMTEFAYGALGVNTCFGTPRSPIYPDASRVAGGSSSGAAAAVARDYSDFAICSDTSGSARIPAAFCGVVGFKPSRNRYPTEGMSWLSTSFDVPGIIASSVKLCRLVDDVVTQRDESNKIPAPIGSFNLVLPLELDNSLLDEDVRIVFEAAIAQLKAAGMIINIRSLGMMNNGAKIAVEGGIISAEAYTIHRENLARDLDKYDPRVGPRLLNGEHVPAFQYLAAQTKLEICKQDFDAALDGFDAYISPTVPMLPPSLSALDNMDTYLTLNSRSFSLTELANRLDLPSISVPIGATACGFMLTGARASDKRLLAIAEALEPILTR